MGSAAFGSGLPDSPLEVRTDADRSPHLCKQWPNQEREPGHRIPFHDDGLVISRVTVTGQLMASLF